jgi:hypothetical protein
MEPEKPVRAGKEAARSLLDAVNAPEARQAQAGEALAWNMHDWNW